MRIQHRKRHKKKNEINDRRGRGERENSKNKLMIRPYRCDKRINSLAKPYKNKQVKQSEEGISYRNLFYRT